jgi:hypothetical protein
MDLAIFSARIFTGLEQRPWAEALHIKGNRIAAVGDASEVKASCSGHTEKIELAGRLVTPGLVDAHTHFVNLGFFLETVNLRNLPSLAACREKIRDAAVSRRPGEWIVGRGWNHHIWKEMREPDIRDIDDLTPQNPAMLVRACGHSVWVNSLALREAGIDRNTPDPPGGRIDRDPATGNPTGMIREARALIEQKIPAPGPEKIRNAALAAQREAVKAGLTGVHSCEKLAQWEALSALDAEGKLLLRVHHLLPPDQIEAARAKGIRPGSGTEKIWFGHVKLFADGSLGAGTALLHEPYIDEPDQCGIACLPVGELEEKIRTAYAAGWDVAIHAIGDLAVTNCLYAIEAARKTHPGPRRDRIEHVQLFRPSDLSLFKDLGVVASVQPVFVPTDWIPAEKRWGHTRCTHSYAWKTLAETGVPVQFGSDAPVEPIDPILGLQAAVTRQTTAGEPAGGWCPSQRLTLEESIRGFTRVAAWTARKEEVLGTIAPGKWADLTVFCRDLFQVPAENWPSVGIEMTVVGGEIVYRKE